LACTRSGVQEESLEAVALDSGEDVSTTLFATTVIDQAQVIDASVSIFGKSHEIWAGAFVSSDSVGASVTAWTATTSAFVEVASAVVSGQVVDTFWFWAGWDSKGGQSREIGNSGDVLSSSAGKSNKFLVVDVSDTDDLYVISDGIKSCSSISDTIGILGTSVGQDEH